jgi:hypothetical protein
MTAVTTVALLCTSVAFAEETAGEKVSETANSAKATTKKAAHKVSEQACTGTKAECAKNKAANKVDETKDDATNKANETKNKLN